MIAYLVLRTVRHYQAGGGAAAKLRDLGSALAVAGACHKELKKTTISVQRILPWRSLVFDLGLSAPLRTDLQCPVLTQAFRGRRPCATLTPRHVPLFIRRTRYAMSSTDLGHEGTRLGWGSRPRCPSSTPSQGSCRSESEHSVPCVNTVCSAWSCALLLSSGVSLGRVPAL